MLIYRTKEGDTLSSVARRHGILPTVLAEANGLVPDAPLTVGEALILRHVRETATAREGDTPMSLARRHRIRPYRLLQLNPSLAFGTVPYDGMRIALSTEEPSRGSLSVLGFLHPATERKEYLPLLPFLSYLALLGWRLDKEGKVTPPEDGEAVRAARENGVVPLAVLTAEQNMPLSALLGKGDVSAEGLSASLRERGYGGVVLDLGEVSEECLPDYTAFLGALRRRLGHTSLIMATLPPRRGGLDLRCRALGRAAGALLLEAHAIASRFSFPSPEAPYDKVSALAAEASGLLRPQKLFLGLSTRALDFPVNGGAGRVIPPSEVRRRCERGQVSYDPAARVPYLAYREGAEERVLFFEDAESLHEKLSLAERYGFGGIALHPLVGTDIRVLGMLAELFRIVKPYGG